jgi:Arc/MetJ family transcription regulator
MDTALPITGHPPLIDALPVYGIPHGPASCLALPYQYGRMVWMKKTLHIDEELLKQAKLACSATTDTETVRLGLEALIRHAAYVRLKALRGTEPDAKDVPRRREKAGSKRRRAA